MIGIFGGTFDPIHYGHLRAALEAKECFGLDEVRFIPSADPPHRSRPMASADNRMAMLQLAIAGQSGFVADDREIARNGKSYMVDTLRTLRSDFPDQALLLFIGTDAFNNLDSWHQWQQLFDFSHIVVLTRPGYQPPKLAEFFAVRLCENPKKLANTLAGHLYFQTITQLDISATAIRDMLAKNKNPRFLLPDAVLDYIKQNQLYQTHNKL